MLARPYAVIDLEVALWEPGSLVRCRFPHFVALPLWGRWSGVCQCGVEGTPTTDSLTAVRLDSTRVYNHNYSVHLYLILDVQTRSLRPVSHVADDRSLRLVVIVLSESYSFPAQACTRRRQKGAMSTNWSSS
jgi:hypothetical protein